MNKQNMQHNEEQYEKDKALIDSIVNDWFPAHVDEYKAYIKTNVEKFFRESDDILYVYNAAECDTYNLSEMGITGFINLLFGLHGVFYDLVLQVVLGDRWTHDEVKRWVIEKNPILMDLDRKLRDNYFRPMLLKKYCDLKLTQDIATILDRDAAIGLIAQNPNYTEMVKAYYHDREKKQLLRQFVMEHKPKCDADLYPLERKAAVVLSTWNV